jgi:hypothetical protein
VNREHVRAFLWLRWRLLINQMKRGGIANTVVLTLLAAGGLMIAGGLFLVLFFVGFLALGDASPPVVLYVWDGLIIAFLFAWCIGLITDLQRSEVLSLDRFLHLPVSLSGAFLINYIGSLMSLSIILVVPGMFGLLLGLVLSRGPLFLLQLPLLAAFLLALTAVTYQFQGWLASLMSNPRRRRTVVVVVTMAFILLLQLPNLINVARPWEDKDEGPIAARHREAVEELDRALRQGQIDLAEHQRRTLRLQREQVAEQVAAKEAALRQVERVARLVNLALPPGWLPLGVAGLAEQNAVPALLATLGLTLIGTLSLRRAYRTTLRLYTGQYSSGKAASAAPVVRPKAEKASAGLLERRLPGLSEEAAAIALASFRSLLRAPEAKMLLLTPFILLLVFGSLLLTKSMNLPAGLRPLLPFGAMSAVLLSMVQLTGNQFGFDRGGFRVFVLCPAPRRDILLGKNVAVAPLALGLGTLMVVVLQALYPMRLDHFLAFFPQMTSMYLLYCLPANLLSILAPLPIAAGTLKPANPRLIPVVFQIAFVFVFPPILGLTLLPLGLEALLAEAGLEGVPVCLALSLLLTVGVVFLYRLGMAALGRLLQQREQRVLEAVTSKSE